MDTQPAAPSYRWLCTGHEMFPSMLREIETAQSDVRLETYIFSRGDLADRFLTVLVAAAQRGVKVQVLIDGLGSYSLPNDYWAPLQQAGGEARVFNPLKLHRLGIRNHRKLLVCDRRVAFVGGFNIAQEYDGDGVTCGWCDLGLKLEGPMAAQLATAFDEMFSRANFEHGRFPRLRKSVSKRKVEARDEQLLLSGPGRGRNPIKQALKNDLAQAAAVQIMAAYFLPTWRIRRQLSAISRRGGTVQLLLAGKSDVAISQLAGQSLYRRFLQAGVQIYEYQPQILHAKLILIDDIVYVGSANLDQRSLLNYELMLRLEGAAIAARAREIFADNLRRCTPITLESWRASRSLWRRLKQRWSYWLLVRLDPYIARRQWQALLD